MCAVDLNAWTNSLSIHVFAFAAELGEKDRLGKKGKKSKSRKRKSRGSVGAKSEEPKTLTEWIEEEGLEELPEYEPTYLTAVARPSRTRAARCFCSICGQSSAYTCTRCGARFCCMKCYVVHTDTRCLKFTS
jgi:zinc finger HIT domain-containing protein 1